MAEKYGYEPIRYLMISSHYRTPINYSVEIIESCKSALERLYNCRGNLEFLIRHAAEGPKEGERELRRLFESRQDRFIEAMEDDLNTADALSALFDLAKDLNTNLTAEKNPSKELCLFALDLFNDLAGVLGLLYEKPKTGEGTDDEIERLIEERAKARAAKDWATADRIRDELKARHVALEDTPQGVKWKIEE